MTKPNFLEIVEQRGYYNDSTDKEGLNKLFADSKPTVTYIGFDCTAPSLHVGSLVQIMLIRRLQQTGNKPIVLLGGATTKVGDPSGKDATRPVLSEQDIEANMAGIKKVFEQFDIKFGDGETDALLVNNDDWFKKLGYIEFLRDVGRHFSVNKMLAMESVKQRIDREQHMSFIEFNYMVLQAYDFVKLYQDYGCRVQIGGSDQWGNIVNGTELQKSMSLKETKHEIPKEKQEETLQQIAEFQVKGSGVMGYVREKFSKELEGKFLSGVSTSPDDITYKAYDILYGLTTPLITTASGAKMGKTADGAVWLTADRYKPYDYWQFWRNAEDADVWRFMRLFTDIDNAQITAWEAAWNSGSESGAFINEKKVMLATAATTLCHGEAAAKDAEATAKKVFEQGGVGDSLPVVEIAKAELEAGIPAFKILQLAGLSESGGEARRLVKGGGAKVNDVKINNAEDSIGIAHLNDEGVIKLSSGKKKHALVKVA